MSVTGIAEQADDIVLEGLSPSEALVHVRELLISDASRFGAKIYDALLEVAWQITGDRATWQKASNWLDLFGHAAGMLRESGLHELSWQVAALGDLIDRSARFAELQPLDEVLTRRHVADVIRVLSGSGGRMDRLALLQASGLKQSNLSRMLALLEGHGLVRRVQEGRETKISLTAAGKEVAAGLVAGTAAEPAQAGLDSIWQSRDIGICLSRSDGTLLAANPSFEDAVGISAELAAARIDCTPGMSEMDLGEQRWAKCVVAQIDQATSLSLWFDVSDLREAEQAAKARAFAAEAEVVKLKAQAVSTEQMLKVFAMGVGTVRDRLAGRMTSIAEAMLAPKVPGEPLQDMPYPKIMALKSAMVEVLDAETMLRQVRNPVRRNVQDTIQRVLSAARTLTGRQFQLRIPEGCERLETDYGILAKPLRALLIGNTDLSDLDVTVSQGKVVIVGKKGVEIRLGNLETASDPMGSAYAAMLAATWKPLGVDIALTETDDHAIQGFRMTVPTALENVSAL